MAYSWSDFAEYARAGMGKAPDFVYIRTAKSVIRDFCSRTQAWAEPLDPVTVFANMTEADMDLPGGADLVAVVSVVSDGGMALVPGRDYFTLSSANTLMFPVPAGEDTTLAVTAALMPSRNATSLPDLLYDMYLDAITDGIIANLRSQSGQGWYDPSIAMFHKSEYLLAISRAKMNGYSGGRQNANLTVRMRPLC